MKKITLRNLVALAVLALGTTHVMADVVETKVVDCNFENNEVLFGNDSRITVANVEDAGINSNVVSFTTATNSTNGYSLSTYNFSEAIGDDATSVKVEFDFKIAGGNAAYYRYFTIGQADLRTGFGAQSYTSAGAIFGFGLSRQSRANYFSINGAKTTAEGNASNVLGTWAHVSLTVNLSEKKVSYEIASLDRNTAYYSGEVPFYNSDPSKCNQIDFFDCANSFVSYMDNLVVTKYVDNSKVSTIYTIKYQNADGDDVKASKDYDCFVGDSYTATEADMATFYSEDGSLKYIYSSGNETKTAKEDGNVITLVFDEYEKVSYTVTAKNGETTLKTIASGEAYSDGSTTVYWSKYNEVEGQWYETAAPYGKTITEAGNTDVAFTESDITYFVEVENINKSRSAAANALGTQFSGGKTERHYSSSQWWTAPFAEGGDYILTFPYSMANASASTLVIKTRNEDGTFTETGKSLTANTPGTFSETITVPAGSSIAICNDAAYNSNILIDYVAVKRVAPETIEVTMASCGYATLCSEYALDFSENEDVKAYIATELKDGKVVTEQIQMAAAGEGIILKSSSASVTVATTTESVEKNENNKMVGDPKNAINLTANQGYILSANDGLFHPCSEGTLAAGKAYLAIDVVAADGAKVLTLDFAEEGMATAINEVETTTTSDAVFTLGGTRMIGEPTQRGIYIVGGKKVVIK